MSESESESESESDSESGSESDSKSESQSESDCKSESESGVKDAIPTVWGHTAQCPRSPGQATWDIAPCDPKQWEWHL